MSEVREALHRADYMITFHKKGGTKKANKALSPIYLFNETEPEVGRRLWRAENITGNEQRGLTCKVWRFSRDGWQEYDRNLLYRWEA